MGKTAMPLGEKTMSQPRQFRNLVDLCTKSCERYSGSALAERLQAVYRAVCEER